jgi:hypothetical protein
MSHPCPICSAEAERQVVGPEAWLFSCPRCGNFVGANGGVGWEAVKTPEHQVRLSGWVREQNAAAGKPPLISPEISRRVARMPIPSLRERANRALLVIVKNWPGLDDWYDQNDFANDLELQGKSYSLDADSALILMHLLKQQIYLRGEGRTAGLSIVGLLAAEELGALGSGSIQGFVAMSFHESMQDAWMSGFHPAIRAAGYNAMRVDNKDYVGGISDEIIAELRRSRFVVADYTGQVNGVYFEAGFALGFGLTVIPTCRADEFDKLHFDIRHLNTLRWSEPSDLISNLSQRIRAVIGAGPNIQQ